MGILDFISQILGKPDQTCGNNTLPCEQLMQAVDLVVKNSHPNIHYVTNYRKKLLPAVEYTLAYTDKLTSMLKSPVKIDRDSWDNNPQITPLFVNKKKFMDFFYENNELNEFFRKTGASSCCALLVMDKTEKTIFGAELEGEIIKRDVIKKSVNFSRHSIVTPAISEKETRNGLSLLILSLLASQSLKEILSLIEWKEDMENEKKMLEIQIQMHNASIKKTRELLPDPTDNDEDIKEAKEILKQLDSKIAEARTEMDEPEDYLNRVEELLYHPERYLKAEPVKIRLNDMNIVVENNGTNNGTEKASDMDLLEFTSSEGIKKLLSSHFR